MDLFFSLPPLRQTSWHHGGSYGLLKMSSAAEQSLCLSQCYGQLAPAFPPSLPVSLQLPWDSLPPKTVNI